MISTYGLEIFQISNVCNIHCTLVVSFFHLRDSFRKSFEQDSLLIIQCGAGHRNGDLIAYAKYRIDDVLQEVLHTYRSESEQPRGKFHVLMTVYLPRCIVSTHVRQTKSSFIVFLVRDWICGHIDEFFSVYDLDEDPVSLSVKDTPLSELFKMLYSKELSSVPAPDTLSPTQCFAQLSTKYPKLNFLIQSAVSRANQTESSGRVHELNDILCSVLSHHHPHYTG